MTKNRPRGLSEHDALEWLLTNRAAWDGECLVWTKATTGGYAATYVGDRAVLVPRLIVADQLGVSVLEMPRTTYALHSCDRGHEGCVTPEHIRPGTATENNLDASSRGRHGMTVREACPQGHRLVEGNLTPSLLKLGKRHCLVCSRARARVQHSPSLTLEEAIQAVLTKSPELKEFTCESQ